MIVPRTRHVLGEISSSSVALRWLAGEYTSISRGCVVPFDAVGALVAEPTGGRKIVPPEVLKLCGVTLPHAPVLDRVAATMSDEPPSVDIMRMKISTPSA